MSGDRIPVPGDLYDAWMAVPAELESPDDRFEVCKIPEPEFERVYLCVDDAFRTRRPREVYDWLYRRNPYGRARVWAVVDKATGRVLKTGATFPWPVWRGLESIPGGMSGDDGTVQEWQRKGIGKVRRVVTRSHPWRGRACVIAGPNQNSRAVSARRGEAEKVIGRLQGGVLPLKPVSEGSGARGALAMLANGAIELAMKGWQGALLGQGSNSFRIAPLSRFTSEFDAVTLRAMGFSGYWCPHSSEFLNWRYLDRPLETYEAIALLDGEVPVGYAVLRLSGSRAALAEFAVDEARSGASATLMRGVIEHARAAHAAYLTFFGPPRWRHWSLFRRAGMVPVPTDNYFEVSYSKGPEDALDFTNWQITPGDRDYH